MASYKISEQTRMNLILAAGELFAEKGTEGTTTREIASKAGTAQNAIAYHFGGIGGLENAVWDFVLAQWHPEQFFEFLKEALPKAVSRKERAELTAESIHRLFRMIHEPERPFWITRFLVRASLTEAGKSNTGERITGKVIPALRDLFFRLTGSENNEDAWCWSTRIAAAPVVFTADLTALARFRKGENINRELFSRLEQWTIRDALLAAGFEQEWKDIRQ